MNIASLRFVCILQFAFAGLMALSSFVYIFNAPGVHSVVSFFAFCSAVYLAAFVLQVIYKNYPETPLSPGQKSTFNWLFVLNFFMFAVLITYNINDVKLIAGLSGDDGLVAGPLFYANVLLHLLTTFFQVFILVNMVKLRRVLNRNYEKN